MCPSLEAAAGDRVLVVVPTYNERENIEMIIPALLALSADSDVLIVDDNSPDGTGRRAAEVALTEPRLHVLHRARKEGIGPAYIDGFRWALERGYGRIVQMDADFSHQPTDLPRLLSALESADVVVGSRRVGGGAVRDWSLPRRLLSSFGSWYARLILGLAVHDCTSGFKAIRRAALVALDLDSIRANGYAFQVELLYAWTRLRARIAEVPIVFPDRERGESKMSVPIALEAAWVVLALRLRAQGSSREASPDRRPLNSKQDQPGAREEQEGGRSEGS